MKEFTSFIDPSVLDKIRSLFDFIRDKEEEPLTVVIMGQTGVGKTSLVNALFNVNLPTGDVSPVTKEPQPACAYDQNGKKLLVFWDMPGVGESEEMDEKYLVSYREKILKADIAIWAIHADTRSVTFDTQSIKKIIEPLSDSDKKKVISKISFVITKCDLVSPTPWVLGKKKDKARFAASREVETLLDKKSEYFRQTLLLPFKDYFECFTYKSGDFRTSDGNISIDKYLVTYRGLIEQSDVDLLTRQYPDYQDVFSRLYNNTKVVYCSTRYKFNLPEVINTIVNRVNGETPIRLKKFIKNEIETTLNWSIARDFVNFQIYDEVKMETVYDLRNI